jgi:hypothetical protein
MQNDIAYKRLRMAEALDSCNTETVVHGGCKSTLRGTESERLRLRRFVNDLHARGRLNVKRAGSPEAWNCDNPAACGLMSVQGSGLTRAQRRTEV